MSRELSPVCWGRDLEPPRDARDGDVSERALEKLGRCDRFEGAHKRVSSPCELVEPLHQRVERGRYERGVIRVRAVRLEDHRKRLGCAGELLLERFESGGRLLGPHRLDEPVVNEADVLDRLAATYVEVGKLSGAREINELALANDSGKAPAKTCQRLTRRVLLDPETYRTSKSAFTTKAPVPGFTDDPTSLLFGAKLGTDPQCRELDAQVSCWLIKSNCSAWYKLRGISEADAFLLDARMAWPTGKFRADEDAWWNVINPALKARPKREAYAFAVLALESSLKLTDCNDDFGMVRARDLMSQLANDSDTPPDVVTRLTWLDENRTKLCFRPY